LPLKSTIITAFVGQCSEQAPQAVFSVSTMQFSFTNIALPICTFCFSSFFIELIAEVGQTSEQTIQS